jgi:hypothetical protein
MNITKEQLESFAVNMRPKPRKVVVVNDYAPRMRTLGGLLTPEFTAWYLLAENGNCASDAEALKTSEIQLAETLAYTDNEYRQRSSI